MRIHRDGTNWRKIKTGTLSDLQPPMKKAVHTSLRFTRLNEDAYTRSMVYRDNEDLRTKVSRGSRGFYMYSRGTKPKNKTRKGATFGEEATHGTCTMWSLNYSSYVATKIFFMVNQISRDILFQFCSV